MSKIKVGITGQSGFMGTHLYNFLKFKSDEIQLIPFEDDFFKDSEKLEAFVSKCDTLVHLAAMNRHGDPQVIYDTNLNLVKSLLDAIEATKTKPHIVFSSSTQEERDNLYGHSKKDGRLLFERWADVNRSIFTGLVIPNVFGPLGVPFYNSVISTFCHQLTHNENPRIEIDANLKLIYVNNLIYAFYDVIINKQNKSPYYVKHNFEIKVSDILKKLNNFKSVYLKECIIPELNNEFDVSLFNTFKSYIDKDFYPFKLKLHSDERGHLFEMLKTNTKGQIFYSETKPGITRGNHFHTRKIERFCVVKGNAVIKLRKIGSDEIIEYQVNGNEPSIIDMPIHFTHNITNTGNDILSTLFWTNEFFDPEDPDTYFEEV
jgi:UDP-2-acetamido-2,6-beta-L-arabino-hexul-4-ose reductase